MDLHIDKPKLDKATPEENIAIVDKWISDVAEQLNVFSSTINEVIREVKKDVKD